MGWQRKGAERYGALGGAVHRRDWVTADKLEFEESQLSGEASLSLKNVEIEKKQIIRALEQANGNRSLAAELLGIGRTTLYDKMKKYNIRHKE